MSWAALRSRLPWHLNRSFSSLAGGFAGIQGLRSASDWDTLAKDAELKCRSLVQDVITTPPSIATLCQVLDAAEFCRNVHSDPAWREAAGNVCASLGAVVHDLNTNYAIYTALKAALPPSETINSSLYSGNTNPYTTDTAQSGFDEESLLVGRMLQRDFERYGVHLSGTKRDDMADLVARTQALGFTYMRNCIDPDKSGYVELEGAAAAKSLGGLPPQVQRAFRPRQPLSSSSRARGTVSGVLAQGTSTTLNSLMWHADDEAVRRAAYAVYNTCPADNLAILDELVTARHDIATLMGFSSFAEYQLDQFSLAGTPHAVNSFLQSLGDAIKPACEAEARVLLETKQRYNVDTSGNYTSASSTASTAAAAAAAIKAMKLQPWDRYWAANRVNTTNATSSSASSEADVAALGHYLTLDGCVNALSTLLEGLMGVRLREEAPAKGEVWAPGVRRLVAEHQDEGILGVVYLDLYRRRDKFAGAAHFTLRCGRRLQDGTYQTPVVALVANMSPGSGAFSHHELETLLHEFGHALNSLLSRTHYQHLSGTRGPQDVIEIPSHVFERFATDPRALELFCRASSATSSNKQSAPPAKLLASAAASKRRFAALNLQGTLQLALIDQLLHGDSPPIGSEVDRRIGELMQEHSALGHAPGTYPHLRFQHIVGYGANYYCYLFAQSVSAALWQQQGAGNEGGSSEGWPDGRLLRRQLLEPGGAKIAQHYVSDIFGGVESCKKSGVLIEGADGGCYPDITPLLKHLGVVR